MCGYPHRPRIFRRIRWRRRHRWSHSTRWCSRNESANSPERRSNCCSPELMSLSADSSTPSLALLAERLGRVERVKVDVRRTMFVASEDGALQVQRLRRNRARGEFNFFVSELRADVNAPSTPAARAATVQSFAGDVFSPAFPLRLGARTVDVLGSTFGTLAQLNQR